MKIIGYVLFCLLFISHICYAKNKYNVINKNLQALFYAVERGGKLLTYLILLPFLKLNRLL